MLSERQWNTVGFYLYKIPKQAKLISAVGSQEAGFPGGGNDEKRAVPAMS